MFHDFAYRLQESAPNKSASNEFVRKRALSFLYGMPRLVRCTPLSAGQIHDKACMVVDVELVTLELARTSRTDFTATGHPAKGAAAQNDVQRHLFL